MLDGGEGYDNLGGANGKDHATGGPGLDALRGGMVATFSMHRTALRATQWMAD
jgi:hypothetical protein